MTTLVSSPRLLDAIIALVVVELVMLVAYRVRRARGMPATEVIAFLGAGLAMLVAMRVATREMWTAGSIAAFAAAMLASLVLHAWHVVQRWRR